MKRTTIRLGNEYQTAQEIADRWGLGGAVSALRLSLRVIAESLPQAQLPTNLRGEAGTPRTIVLEDEDVRAAETIAGHYGLKSTSAAVRVALYWVANRGLTLREN